MWKFNFLNTAVVAFRIFSHKKRFYDENFDFVKLLEISITEQ